MKWLIALLLSANLLFAMWWLWVAPDSAPRVRGVTSRTDVPQLVMLSELKNRLAGDNDNAIAGLTMAAPEPIVDDGSVDAVAASVDAVPAEPVDAATTGSETTEPTVDAAGTPIASISPRDAGAGQVSAPVDAAAGSARLCMAFGPFLNLREATLAAAKLRAAGYDPAQRLADSQVWMGFWVHLPAFPSRADAVRVVDGLRTDGVTDIYIEPAGEYRNTVSLGVFSDRERAEAHAAKVRALDVEPQIADRYRTDSVYWIDLEAQPGIEFDAARFRDAGQEVRVESRDCP